MTPNMFVEDLIIEEDYGDELRIEFDEDKTVTIYLRVYGQSNSMELGCKEIQKVYDRLGAWLDQNCVC